MINKKKESNENTDKYKKWLLVLSPSYFVYNYMKADSEIYSKDAKEYNKINSNNNKHFYYGLSIFIIFLINLHCYKDYYYIIQLRESPLVYLGYSLNLILKVGFLVWLSYHFFSKIERLNSEDKSKDKIFKKITKENFKNHGHILKLSNYVMIHSKWIFSALSFIAIFFAVFCKYEISSTLMIIFKLLILYFYGISRVIHFFLVFLGDAKKKLNRGDINKDLVEKEKTIENNETKKRHRLYLAANSYISLIIDYGILYFTLNNAISIIREILGNKSLEMYQVGFNNIFHAIYFSGVTITTIGYGDIYPKSTISMFYVLIEVLSGMFLIGVNLSIYLNEK